MNKGTNRALLGTDSRLTGGVWLQEPFSVHSAVLHPLCELAQGGKLNQSLQEYQDDKQAIYFALAFDL